MKQEKQMKNMDNKKIAFICCVNDESKFAECEYYINHLAVPFGFSLEIFPVYEALGMAEGYNRGMKRSDAKYKIYLHQDVFCIDVDLLHRLLEVFQDATIGIIGYCGVARGIPLNGEFIQYWDSGRFLLYNGIELKEVNSLLENEEHEAGKGCEDVYAIDGMFIATQYDIPWDEGIPGWHFYDIALSFRFRYAGYRSVVLTDKSRILHDSGVINVSGYEKSRKLFCEYYSEYGYDFKELESTKEKKEYNVNKSVFFQLLREKKYETLEKNFLKIIPFIEQGIDISGFDDELLYMSYYLIIRKEELMVYGEQKTGWTDFIRSYIRVKYFVWKEYFFGQKPFDKDMKMAWKDLGTSEVMFRFILWNITLE